MVDVGDDMNKTVDDVIDVNASNESASLEKVFQFASDVAIDSAFGVLSGVVSTVGDIGGSCLKVINGDFKGAGDIVKSRVEGVITGTIGTVKSGVALADASYKTFTKDEAFLTHENKVHAKRLCQFGIYSLAGSAIVGESVPEGDNCQLHGDACNLPGVENGVFKGDAQDLQVLTEQGQIEGTTHLENGDYTRSDSAKADFLEAHSIEDTKGWQIHHVQPLSEGGADEPSNMVLVQPDEHSKITAAHSDFYGWKK